MTRVGLGRRRLVEENAGDPLDGLVNLFDIGMVLAVAFLIAGVGLTLHSRSKPVRDHRPPNSGRVLPSTASAPTVHGRAEPVGQVYRLADGRLVYVKRPPP